LSESQAICLKIQQQAYELTQQLQEEKNKLVLSDRELDKLRYQYRSLENERNSLNDKLHVLTRDMTRVLRDGMEVEDLERMLNDYTAISAELATVKAQRKTLSEEVTSLTQKLAVSSASSGPSAKTVGGEALRNALLQKFELERVVKELTEYVNAKEMQIETLKNINRALTQELYTLRKN
jgi:chromosome segregation ATPase